MRFSLGVLAVNANWVPPNREFTGITQEFWLKRAAPASHDFRVETVKSPTDRGAAFQEHRLMVGDKQHSFWHDVPLRPDDNDEVFHFVCETPIGTKLDMQVQKETAGNPIVQEVNEDGSPAIYSHAQQAGTSGIFAEGMIVNHGFLSQTYTHPDHKEPGHGLKYHDSELHDLSGDDGVLDALQINDRPCTIGEIQKVRILGSFAAVDDGRLVWKIIVQDVADPNAAEGTLAQVVPGPRRMDIHTWFKDFQVADGGERNTLAYGGKWLPINMAMDVINESHGYWKALFEGSHAAEL